MTQTPRPQNHKNKRASSTGRSSSSHEGQSREVALDMLGRILNKRQPMDVVLDQHHGFQNLTPRDRGFVRMMLATTLRKLLEIDRIILEMQTRPDQPLPPALTNILRLGVVQLLYLNTADHAAVDMSVRLAQSSRLSKFKGLVNAILRNIQRHKNAQDLETEKSDNIPPWLFSMWVNDFGIDIAQKIAAASLNEAELDITPKNPSQSQKIADMLGGDVLWNGSIRLPAGGQVQNREGYEDGSWWVQDISAALPVRFLGEVIGRTVLDLCAAPGGKTAQIAAAGGHVQAIDRSAKRLERLMENMRRLRLDKMVEPISADVSVWRPKNLADAI